MDLMTRQPTTKQPNGMLMLTLHPCNRLSAISSQVVPVLVFLRGVANLAIQGEPVSTRWLGL